MSVRDFPPRSGDLQIDSFSLLRWLDKLGDRQNIDSLNTITPATGDELYVFDVSGNLTGKTTVADILALATPASSGGGEAPLNVNPNWLVDQINEGALYTVNTATLVGPDGWSGDNTGAGVFKLRTLADPDNAALKCLEITCTTADASIAAGDRYEVWTAIEGYDASTLMSGTSTPATITIQFNLKSNSVTGVFGVYLSNSAGNRFYAGTITVAGTTEASYSLTVTLDTTGTWLYTNGIGLRIGLVLSAGSNFQGTAGAWTASTVRTTSSQANFMSANTNIIYLKRFHVMRGSSVVDYQPANFERELAKCQRYYYKTYNQGVAVAATSSVGVFAATADGTGTGGIQCTIPFAVTLRASPTVSFYSSITGSGGAWRRNSGAADCNMGETFTSGMSCALGQNTSAITLGEIVFGHVTASARLS